MSQCALLYGSKIVTHLPFSRLLCTITSLLPVQRLERSTKAEKITSLFFEYPGIEKHVLPRAAAKVGLRAR